MKLFTFPDKTEIIIDDDNSIFWSPDTCQCQIIHDLQFRHQFTYRVCALHEQFTKQALVNQIRGHHNNFNKNTHGKSDQDEIHNERAKAKSNERSRIKAIGDPHKP